MLRGPRYTLLLSNSQFRVYQCFAVFKIIVLPTATKAKQLYCWYVNGALTHNTYSKIVKGQEAPPSHTHWTERICHQRYKPLEIAIPPRGASVILWQEGDLHSISQLVLL